MEKPSGLPLISHVSRLLPTIFKNISRTFEVLGGLLVLVMMLTITVEVTVRTIWGKSTMVAFDLVGILLGCAVFLGLAESYRAGAHVRIGSFVMRLSERARRVLDVLVWLATFVYASLIFRYSLSLALDSLRTNAQAQTLLRFPLFPFQIIVPIGTLLFMIILIISREASKLK